MSKAINNCISIFLCFCIGFTPAISFAESGDTKSLVTNLQKGDKAPFEGILLSEASAAKLFAEIKFSQKECDALLDKRLELQKIKLDSKIASLESLAVIEKKRTQSLMSIKDERIKFLEDNYLPPAWYESNELWLGIGVVIGIGLTAIAGYAIGQVGDI